MALGFWLFSAAFIAGTTLLLVLMRADYRIILVSCAIIGLTPLGFINGSGVPVLLPELLIIALAIGALAHGYESIGDMKIPAFLTLFCAFFLLQFVFSLLSKEAGVIDLIRDCRPIAFVALLLLLSSVLQQLSWRRHVREAAIALVVIICLAFDLFYYSAANVGWISAGGISGEFYSRTGLIRYSDLLTIALFGLANYMVFSIRSPTRALLWLAVCAIIVGTSLNRVFAFGFVVALTWWLYSIARQYTRMPGVPVVAASMPAVILAITAISFARSQPEASEVVSRITELFSISLLVDALQYRFVDPALAGGYEFTPLTFMLGEGMGFKFYVPWFEYRGLDPWHFSVDSLFAFAFFKYGIVGMLLLVYAVTKLIWARPWTLANAWIWLYLFVHSGINVPGFLMFLIVLVVLRDASWLLVTGDVRVAVDDDRGAKIPTSTEISAANQ